MDHPEQDTVAETEKKRRLFRQQKETLDIFLRNGAITRAQYDKSLGDLMMKMGIEEKNNSLTNM